MKPLPRCLVICLAFLLLGASPLPLQLQPEQPRLGEPLVVIIQLPSSGWEVSGYPDLRPFRLLGEAEIDGEQLRLKLLPLRPGPATLPALPLHKGSRSWISPARQIEIEDPYQGQQQPADLRAWPERDQNVPGWVIAILLFAALSIGLGMFRQPKMKQPSDSQNHLESFSRRLEQLASCPEKGRLQLQLDGWRFGPYPAEDQDLAAWEEHLAALEKRS